MRTRLLACLGVAVALLAAGRAAAQSPTYAYRWSADGGATLLPATGASVTVGGAGSTTTLRLVLVQTGGSPSNLVSPGLFSAGARVTFTNSANGSAVQTAADPDLVGNVTGGNSFNDTSFAYFRDLQPGYVDLSEATNNPNVGVTAVAGRLFVGDFRFTVQGTGLATTEVTAFSPQNGQGAYLYPNLLAGSGQEIDGALAPATLSLVPVPEPAGLLALAAGALAVRRWRGR